MYIVINKFKDLEDNDHIYQNGDEYPREGISIEDIHLERIKTLASNQNKIGKVLIKEINTGNKNENTEEDPGANPNENTEEDPGANPKENTDEEPGVNSEENTDEEPGVNSEENTDEEPGVNSEENTDEESELKAPKKKTTTSKNK